jgi:hypothetical protein
LTQVAVFPRLLRAIALGLAMQSAAQPDCLAQTEADAILELPNARLQVIGLKRWTLSMLQDSLARRAPGQSLASHACAAVLRKTLGFPDAAVQYYGPGFQREDTKGFWAVTVIEPQDSARVRYRPEPEDSLPDPPGWAAALEVIEQQNRAFQAAIQRPAFLLASVLPDTLDPDLLPARPLLEFLLTHGTSADRRQALRILTKDANGMHRALSAVLLARFAEDDSTWGTLVDALRDPNGIVSATASQVLGTLGHALPRTVNWTPFVPSLRALLDGTNLFAYNTVLTLLAQTKVSPALARPLLRGGGELLVAKLRSQDPFASHAAHRLLVQLAGEDLGVDAIKWQRWLAAL